MDALNNSTSTGGIDLSTTAGIMDYVFWTLAIFLGSWIILFFVMYFIAPYIATFADKRSRIVYSFVYTLPFAIIFGLGLGGTMSLLSSANLIISLVMAFVIVFALVMFQSFLLGWLTSKGILKMETKARQQQKMTKGKRK